MFSKQLVKVSSSLLRGSFRSSIRRGACSQSNKGLQCSNACSSATGKCRQQKTLSASLQVRAQTTAAALAHDSTGISTARADDGQKMMEVTWTDGSQAMYPFVWLRDSCQCSTCWHPTTKSRLLRMGQVDPNVTPMDVQTNESSVSVIWSDGHQSVYDAQWLQERQFTKEAAEKRLKRNWIRPKYWGSELQDRVPAVDYEEFMNDDRVLYEWLCSMEEIGLHFIKNAPQKEGALQAIANRVAYLRKHNYGVEFHVKSKPDPNNLAFTNVTLGLHTDNPYYYYVPGVQMLHCIKQAGTEGGDNVFADGFNAANQLRTENPKHFAALTQLPVDFYDVGKEGDYDYFLRTRKPTVNIDDQGEIYQINYNNQVRETELNLPLEKVIPYFEALKAYDNQLYHPKNAVQHKLKPGEVVCFHNYRVLHGRLGYQMQDGGERHLNGGFLDWDEMHSMRRVIQTKLGL